MKSAITRVKRLSKMRLNIHERETKRSLRGKPFWSREWTFFQAKLWDYIQVEEFQKNYFNIT